MAVAVAAADAPREAVEGRVDRKDPSDVPTPGAVVEKDPSSSRKSSAKTVMHGATADSGVPASRPPSLGAGDSGVEEHAVQAREPTSAAPARRRRNIGSVYPKPYQHP